MKTVIFLNYKTINMKKFLLNIWYTILYQFDQHRNEIPVWWYEDKPFAEQPEWMQRMSVAKDVIDNKGTFKP